MSLQFEREHRYFVFKVKNLTQEQQQRLFDFEMELGPRNSAGECVVVESDWPNYLETWDAIRDVSCGTFKPREVLIAERDALAKEVDAANDRIGELARDEPNNDDIIALRMALGKAGISAPESDEELAIRWISYVRHLIRSVSKWGFVAASERDALAAQIEAMREMANRANKHLTKGYGPQVFNALYCNLALSALAELDAFTPQQCLRDVQAEAGRAGFIACLKFVCNNPENWISSADEYAATVRKGGAE